MKEIKKTNELNKILLMILILIFCSICLSCSGSIYMYKSDEQLLFMKELKEKAPISGFENVHYENAYIFVYLRRETEDAYSINFAIFQKNSEIPNFEIEHILITDKLGNIVFEDLNISLENEEIYEPEMDEEYFRFYFSLNELLQFEITREFYNVSIMINGKTIHMTLKQRDVPRVLV